jgi:hypothetical protein
MKINGCKIFFYWMQVCAISFGCAANQPAEIPRGISLLSDEVKRELQGVERTIASVTTSIKYEIQTYQYELVNGQFVPDPGSPLRYKLATDNGATGVIIESDDRTLSGGGLVINYDPENSRYTILTSNHLVSPEDTTEVYFLDENGLNTDVLFARYIVKDVMISVRGSSSWRAEAEIVAADAVDDLAILEVQTTSLLGLEYYNEIGYDLDLSWGDWVFLFGFPKGIKQITGGWVSESPYPGTLTVDAVVRFGFSGGPVFAIAREQRKLVFVGIIKSVPRTNFDYIAPDGTLPMGLQLAPEKLKNLVVKREIMVDYGSAYFVNPKTIKQFFNEQRARIEKASIRLHPKYYGSAPTAKAAVN